MKAKIVQRFLAKLKPSEKPYEVRDPVTVGFLVRVQPTGSMGYYVEFRNESGRKRRVSLGTVGQVRLSAARDAAVRHIMAARLGDDPAEERKKKRKVAVTLRGLLDGAFSEHLTSKGSRTRHRTIQMLKTNFPDLLDKPIGDITKWAIDKWRLARADDQPKTRKGTAPRKVSTATVNRPIANLKSALNVAVENKLLAVNPLSGLHMRREPETVTRFLNDAELGRLMAALREHDAAKHDRLLPFVMIALNAGLRLHEIETLAWVDVDFDNGVLTVRSINAKSGRMRHVPLNATLRAVLEQWREQTGSEGPVFRQGYPKPKWLSLLKAAKITGFRFHDCRHTFASRLAMSGVDMYSLQRLMGHASPLMTQRYAHLSPDHMAAAVAKLDTPTNIVRLDKEQAE